MNATEVLIAAALTLTITGAVLGLVRPAQASFRSQSEAADMHQRLRAGVEALSRDFVMAGAGIAASTAAVMPYRVGSRGSDPEAGVFYRPDAITVRYLPWGAPDVVSHTYYLRADTSADTHELRHYDGLETDLPMVDHVAGLRFEYFDRDGSPIHSAAVQDGPWIVEEGRAPFDADLLRIARIRVHLRVQATLPAVRRGAGMLVRLPDEELTFDIAPRNLHRGG